MLRQSREQPCLQFHYSYWLAPLMIALILFAISLLIRVRALQAIYREKFPETPRERLFWAALGFFVAVAVVRSPDVPHTQ